MEVFKAYLVKRQIHTIVAFLTAFLISLSRRFSLLISFLQSEQWWTYFCRSLFPHLLHVLLAICRERLFDIESIDRRVRPSFGLLLVFLLFSDTFLHAQDKVTCFSPYFLAVQALNLHRRAAKQTTVDNL